ncbi:MAG: alanine--tRNA ligase [Elusimicrobia bacterium RIFOXYB2_FULL_48_7]|nr:MAG: alanine--tRNA ligase [Elusimicrobia bacterium RIFOXYB2_FULL_48_7]
MNSSELRKAFLEFFKNNGHNLVPSDSLVPSSDATLLFSSAGMVQFKKYFLGEEKMSPPRAVSCQKCFRTSDLDQIGHTARHLSFFEMLGNFSFGDYFKKEAIAWGWEFLTKVVKLPEDRLYITVYRDDNEALELWKKIVPADRIYKLGPETNFWTMGPTGPCGPCSEILYDNGKQYGCGKHDCGPDCSCDRWLEIWNLVFTQFNRTESGELQQLKAKNIDTGMGLERLARAVQGKQTVFQTDLFFPIIQELETTFNCNYTADAKTTTALNIISDHIRSITFLIGDGILPSNEGRGYVLRRLVRRALRQAKLLGYDKPFLYKLSNKVIEMMKDAYPELPMRRENIAAVTKMEEEKFIETLDTGMNLLNDLIKKVGNSKKMAGKDVFQLYDTFGFPRELTKEILDEHGIAFDEKEFLAAQETARDLAKSSWKTMTVTDTAVYKKLPATKFVGYEKLDFEATIKHILKDGREASSINEKDFAEIVLDVTPFYAESGGQVGDIGLLKNATATANVLDTQKPVENIIIHKIQVEKGGLSVGDKVTARINEENRKNIMRHHTTTHLLHKALRTVLGEHATQSGSLVAPERFRFDFVHFKSLDARELARIEEIVNEKIMECLKVNVKLTTLKEAREMNATALFGEKYKDDVRCVFVGDAPESAYSMELCGGTHCKNTGEIGLFKIIAETSVGSGLRRIEGVCGKMALKYIADKEFILEEVSAKLKTSQKDLAKRVDSLLAQEKTLAKEIEKLKTSGGAGASAGASQDEYPLKDGKKLVVQKLADPGLDAKNLRSISDNLKDKYKTNSVIAVINASDGKISFVITATKDAVDSGTDVSKPASEFAKLIDGSAGGRKDFAQGGGKDAKKLDEAIAKLKDLFLV